MVKFQHSCPSPRSPASDPQRSAKPIASPAPSPTFAPLVLFLLAITCSSSGCSNNPEQLALETNVNGAMSTTARVFPEYDRRTFDDREACVACFEERCQAQAAQCAESPECTTGVACLRDCSQPTCFVSCYAKQQAVDPSPLAIGYGPTWGAMELCRDERCGNACAYSVDQYGCSGEYDWATVLTGFEGTATLHVRVADLGTLVPYSDLSLSVCSGAPTKACAAFDRSSTDADGRATLTYPVGVPGTVHNYLSLSDPAGQVIPMLLYPPRGIFVPNVHYPMLTTTYAGEDFLPYRGWDHTRFGAIMLVGLDCNGNYAQGWSFEAEGAGDEVRFVYNSPNDAQVTNSTGIAFATNVEPGRRTIVIRRVETGTILARRTVRIEAGVGTLLWVMPPDRVEQAALDGSP